MTLSETLKTLNVQLDKQLPDVASDYQPVFSPYKISGEQIVISGRLGKQNGELLIGKLGQDIDIRSAQIAARDAVIECLSVMAYALGDIDRVTSIVRMLVMVNGTDTFTQPHIVADGASQFITQVFQHSNTAKIMHARSAMVANQLPFGTCLEIELTAEFTS